MALPLLYFTSRSRLCPAGFWQARSLFSWTKTPPAAAAGASSPQASSSADPSGAAAAGSASTPVSVATPPSAGTPTSPTPVDPPPNAENAAEKAAADAARQERHDRIAVHFRRATNTDMLELQRQRGKYWPPQLALTPAAQALPFGPFGLRTFAGVDFEFPPAAGVAAPLPREPAFISLVFRGTRRAGNV